jgi:DNA-binding transcriptional regulator of glucitol operon
VGAVLFVVLGAFCLAMLLRVWQSSRVPRTPKPVPVR